MKTGSPRKGHYALATMDGPLPESCLPVGREVPFGWPALKLDGHGIVLRWAGAIGGAVELRFTLAIDLREALLVELLLANTGYRIGYCEVQYGYPLQTFAIRLFPGLEKSIAEEGVRLKLCHPGKELWIFYSEQPSPTLPEALAPHLFLTDEGESRLPSEVLWERSFGSLCSAASLQIFGWLEGCVLEGLCELARRNPLRRERAEDTVRLHLNHFFADGRLIYVNPRSERVEDRWHNNEHGLMMPALLQYWPDHPAVEIFCETWVGYLRRQMEHLERNLSCEACYTLAYPIALLARRRADPDLLELALDLLLLHQRYLKKDGRLYLQYNYRDRSVIYPNWLRGEAWYLLGHSRVLSISRECGSISPKLMAVEQELSLEIDRLLPLQNADGLWSCFAHQPETGDETSGSAGIAAAFLLAAELGCVAQPAIDAALKAHKALERYLSPDGLLSGVSQSNKIEAGEPLQRYGFRCRSQMGQGLAVQLAAIAPKFLKRRGETERSGD